MVYCSCTTRFRIVTICTCDYKGSTFYSFILKSLGVVSLILERFKIAKIPRHNNDDDKNFIETFVQNQLGQFRSFSHYVSAMILS